MCTFIHRKDICSDGECHSKCKDRYIHIFLFTIIDKRTTRYVELYENKYLSSTENIRKAKLQISFYDYVITPWYEAVAGCLPKARLIFSNIEVNRRHWVDIARGTDPEEKIKQIKEAKSVGFRQRRGRVRTSSLLGIGTK